MVGDSDYFPDYSEQDLQSLIRERRFLAAAHAYASGLIPLLQGLYVAFERPRGLGTIPDLAALSRLFHEVARRITAGQIPVPDELSSEFPDVYDPQRRPEPPGYFGSKVGPPFTLSFQDLNRPDSYTRYLKLRRRTFDEDDLNEVMRNPQFLALMDAYRQGLITGGEARDRIYPDRKDLPRDLSATAYLALQIEVANRIKDGRLKLPSDLRAKYPAAYQKSAAT